jgi:hypothetical protein
VMVLTPCTSSRFTSSSMERKLPERISRTCIYVDREWSHASTLSPHARFIGLANSAIRRPFGAMRGLVLIKRRLAECAL